MFAFLLSDTDKRAEKKNTAALPYNLGCETGGIFSQTAGRLIRLGNPDPNTCAGIDFSKSYVCKYGLVGSRRS